MAIADAYADATTYRSLVSKSDSGEDSEIDTDLKAVSRYLDRVLGRFFTKDARAKARIFTHAPQLNPRTLWVDDIAVSPASIKINEDGDGDFADDTSLASTDYELWPLNADKGPEPRPWTMIYLPEWSGRQRWSNGQPRRVEVTAQWGWPAIPDAIVRATVHLTAILRLESPRATAQIADLDTTIQASREAQGIVRDLANAYRRVQF